MILSNYAVACMSAWSSQEEETTMTVEAQQQQLLEQPVVMEWRTQVLAHELCRHTTNLLRAAQSIVFRRTTECYYGDDALLEKMYYVAIVSTKNLEQAMLMASSTATAVETGSDRGSARTNTSSACGGFTEHHVRECRNLLQWLKAALRQLNVDCYYDDDEGAGGANPKKKAAAAA